MDIAILNEKIVIQKSEVHVDEIGNHISSWSNYYKCSATISSESPKEETSAGAIWDESKIDFTIRWCKLSNEVSSIGFRVVFREKLYDILGVDHLNFKKKAIKLHCKKVER